MGIRSARNITQENTCFVLDLFTKEAFTLKAIAMSIPVSYIEKSNDGNMCYQFILLTLSLYLTLSQRGLHSPFFFLETPWLLSYGLCNMLEPGWFRTPHFWPNIYTYLFFKQHLFNQKSICTAID